MSRRRSVLLGILVCAATRVGFAFDSVQLKATVTPPKTIKNFTPVGLALDGQGRAWVADAQNHQLHLFTAEGSYLASYGRKGSQAAQLQEPHAIAFGPEGRLYVAEAGNDRISVWSDQGVWIGSFGERGSAAGQFHSPWALAVSRDGTVAVADQGSARVQLFSADGVFLQQFDAGAPIDALAIDPTGKIVTLHRRQNMIQTWSAAGQLRASWTGQEPGLKGFDDPAALAISESGLTYIADTGHHQFREVDANGKSLGLFGRSGSGAGQFRELSAIAVQGETVWVADRRNRLLSAFALARSHPEAALTAMPMSRIQVAVKGTLPVAADALAFSHDGILHTLSAAKGELVSWDVVAKSSVTVDLKKLTPPLRSPAGLTTAPSSGALFISDTALDRVFKLDRTGKTVMEFGKPAGMFHNAPGELSNPKGIACSSQGNLFVTDSGHSQFAVFNYQGLFQFAGGEKGSGPGQLKDPVALALDRDRLYVADPGNHKVASFNMTGRALRDTPSLGPDALVAPVAVAVDREGHWFVLDAERQRIVVFDAEGAYIGGFGSPGRRLGALEGAKAFAMNETGDVYVAEERRVQAWHVTLLPPAPTQVSAQAGEGYVSLKWEGIASRYPARYSVWRSSAGVKSQALYETVETHWTDDTLTPGTTYSYAIVAMTGSGVASLPSMSIQVYAPPVTSGPRLAISSTSALEIFPAHYKHYALAPFGTVTVKNNSLAPARGAKLTFMLNTYMDFPAEIPLPDIGSEGSADGALTATLNNAILSITEATALQAQLKARWYAGEQEMSSTANLPVKVYSRNSLRWNVKERFAAFVTPNDPPVLDFARAITVPMNEAHAASPVPASIATAWAVFSGLGTYGIHYAPRPNNPYDRVSLDTGTVDSVQFARETLARHSGDCADVTALLASALEAMGLTTAALDAPGHLFLMVDTGESRADKLGYAENHFVRYAGTLWLPLEATMVGEPFLAAWAKAAEQVQRWSAEGHLQPIDIHVAWRSYEPATLPQDPAAAAKAPTKEEIETKFLADWKALAQRRWTTAKSQAEQALKDDPQNGHPWLQLGLIAVEFKKYSEAKTYFAKAESDARLKAAALNNEGNIAYLENNWAAAETAYLRAATADPADALIWVNVARVQYRAGKHKAAEQSYAKALTLSPTLKEAYPDLASL